MPLLVRVHSDAACKDPNSSNDVLGVAYRYNRIKIPVHLWPELLGEKVYSQKITLFRRIFHQPISLLNLYLLFYDSYNRKLDYRTIYYKVSSKLDCVLEVLSFRALGGFT